MPLHHQPFQLPKTRSDIFNCIVCTISSENDFEVACLETDVVANFD